MTNDQQEIRRKKRVIENAENIGNVRKACRYYGIARSTFYLWRDRYHGLGDEGLMSRRCGPHNHPNKTPEVVVDKILHLRRTNARESQRERPRASAANAPVLDRRPSLVSIDTGKRSRREVKQAFL